MNFPTSSDLDVTFDRSELSEYDNLTAFVSFGRAKTPIVRGEVLKQALSDQRLNTLKDLKLYQVCHYVLATLVSSVGRVGCRGLPFCNLYVTSLSHVIGVSDTLP